MMMFVGIPNIARRNSWGSSILRKYLKGPVTSIFALESQISHKFIFKKLIEPIN
jgi:predicted LPLAT superfamily acyltransferase